MPDPLKPAPSLLLKLGSIVVHADELTSPSGHAFDLSALKSLIQDEEVASWLKKMETMAFLPKKR